MTSADASFVSKRLASTSFRRQLLGMLLVAYNYGVVQVVTFAYLIYWWVSCYWKWHHS